jgi:hypothetical protein
VQARVPVVPGKQSRRRELNALGNGMIFLQDDESKQQFMVDTSAVCGVLPQRPKATPTGPPLSDADQPAALRRRREGHSLLGSHPLLPTGTTTLHG